MTKDPSGKESNWDSVWLSTKVFLFLFSNILYIFCTVCTSVWMGSMAFLSVDSRLLGFVVCLTVYVASMGGRDWLNRTLAKLLFDGKDVKSMVDVIGKPDGH